MSEYSYKAYISYSHRDERWAKWLHRAIEAYRVPKKLVGTTTNAGEVPARVKPIFRDRDDLSSASDLSVTVRQALHQSENLIVVCSPQAAASRWVNEEIREFVSLGRSNRIYCIIVDGEAAADGSASACFPDSLTEAGLQEPLAADVRKWADGKRLALLKVIAGLLGLPLDQLRQRDLHKRQKVWALAALASIAVVAIFIAAITARISAQQRRVSGESLVAYKLTELRTMLNVANDPEELARLAQWDAQALAELIATARDGENALTESAKRLRKQGQKFWRDGDSDKAMSRFEESWALLAEQYRLNRHDRSSFFEIGQAEYWIGRIHQDQGNLDAAEDAFMSYAEITRRLILMQPENAEWVLEMSYALTNLGGLENAREAINPVRTLQLMQAALEYNQIALVLDPKNDYYRSELGQSHLNLADAQRNVCDLDGAVHTMAESITLETKLLQSSEGDTNRMRYLAFALSGYSSVRNQQGNTADAQEFLERSLALLDSVFARDPKSSRLLRQVLVRKVHIARLQEMQGKTEEAKAVLDAIKDDWMDFQGTTTNAVRGVLAYMEYLHLSSWLARSRGDTGLAEQLLEKASDRLVIFLTDLPGHREAGNLITHIAFQSWQLKQELPAASVLAQLPDYSSDSGRIRACEDASSAVRKAIMLGEMTQAASLTNYLLDRGYHEADFMRVCRTYNLCK